MLMGAMTSSHRRGGQSRTTTPLWQVTMQGNNDLHGAGGEPPGAACQYGAPGLEGEVALREHLSIMGHRVLHSRAYNLLYALLIMLNSVALVVAVSTPASDPSPLMARLDMAITASLLIEVVVRMLVQGRRRFWSEGSNRFDCCVCALCAATLLLTLLEGPTGLAGRLEQVFTIVVVVVRYGIQLARLAVFVRSFKRTSSGSMPEIDFGDGLEDLPLLGAGGGGGDCEACGGAGAGSFVAVRSAAGGAACKDRAGAGAPDATFYS